MNPIATILISWLGLGATFVIAWCVTVEHLKQRASTKELEHVARLGFEAESLRADNAKLAARNRNLQEELRIHHEFEDLIREQWGRS